VMKTISRRLRKLEHGLGIGVVETDEQRRSREHLEAFLRRVAARRAREGIADPPSVFGENEDLSGLDVADRILLARARRRAQEQTQAASGEHSV
jgi:hypothetical protein